MNIQPSVMIWTVICFFVLMLVLDRLLFRPVLGMMHSRKKKLEYAEAERKVTELRLREENQKRLKALENARRQELDRVAEAVLDAKEAAGRRLSEGTARLQGRFADGRAQLDAEKTQLDERLDERLDALALTLAEKLVS